VLSRIRSASSARHDLSRPKQPMRRSTHYETILYVMTLIMSALTFSYSPTLSESGHLRDCSTRHPTPSHAHNVNLPLVIPFISRKHTVNLYLSGSVSSMVVVQYLYGWNCGELVHNRCSLCVISNKPVRRPRFRSVARVRQISIQVWIRSVVFDGRVR
jgi:hypothetical protein